MKNLQKLKLDRVLFSAGVTICLGRLLYQPSYEPIVVLGLIFLHHSIGKAFSLLRFKEKHKSDDKNKDLEARLAGLESQLRRLEADVSLRLMAR